MEVNFKHFVSTKVALYSADLKQVLIMRYPPRGVNGLPGGHVDRREEPDTALRRELMEELGIEIGEIERVDFFIRDEGRGPIILAYKSIAPANLELNPPDPSYEYGEWLFKHEVADIGGMPNNYKKLILDNWPA